MLEIKNLKKVYKPKKGVPVVALDDVSIKFPETGMVFLLGKSGSGKSTLLNLLGGLDKYDRGEIIIKGVSSKKFRQRHFDSYRNTYVGFIFQEYNILNEFTVGANIALAIELQGRKATDKELNDILAEVDLEGYGARRPNELSGGQKQRVAIARALVKNPKIIMADEPSGALDSVTGKQVFDTLKKLSKDKLVIVVSHDRDFATQYADRIIELADGRVISDIALAESNGVAENGITFDGATARIPAGYHLTEEDRIAINEYIDKLNSGLSIEAVSASKNNRFQPTDESKIERKDTSPFKLIKSKLALKHAFKIGASGLKHKKFRLAMTIFLSCIAFVLFGLVDTFSAYNHISATADSIYDTGIKYATVKKEVKQEEYDYEYWQRENITETDLEELEDSMGISFKGVVSGNFDFQSNLGNKNGGELYEMFSITAYSFSGMIEINEEDIAEKNYELLAGRLPDGGKDEILISRYVFESFKEKGYREYENDKTLSVKTESDMVGKTLFLNNTRFEIVGVVDTKFDLERYSSLKESDIGGDAADVILDYVLYNEFESAVENDFTGMMMVGEGFISRQSSAEMRSLETEGKYLDFYNPNNGVTIRSVSKLNTLKDSEIIWLDGKEREKLDSKEIVVSQDLLGLLGYDSFVNDIPENADELMDISFKYVFSDYDGVKQGSGYKIVGYIKDTPMEQLVAVSDGLFQKFFPAQKTEYRCAIATMPENKKDIRALAELCYSGENGVKYPLNNPASFELDALDEVLDILADVFLYIGIGFAVFAAILLSNFIATSVAYKKREIGILRAIGSRGNDVFRIFFAEAFIIAMINFLLACGLTGLITAIINTVLRQEVGLLITILHFGIRQILVVLAVSLGVAAIASFLPVKKIASKRPIDAIQNK